MRGGGCEPRTVRIFKRRDTGFEEVWALVPVQPGQSHACRWIIRNVALSAGRSVSLNFTRKPSSSALCCYRSSMLHKQHLALAAESLLMIVSIGAAAPQTRNDRPADIRKWPRL